MYISPCAMARWVPAWLSPYLLRLGAYLQDIGRECYHQCCEEKQVGIKSKLEG